jgi:hypothetical protein
MPISTNTLEHLALFTLNKVPAPLLDVFSALGFRIVQAAIRLHVFEVLESKPLTLEELAQQINASPRGTEILLNNLEALGYIQQQKMHYSNTSMTTKWMLNSSPRSIAVAFDYWGRVLFEHFQDLEETIRNGQPATNYYNYTEQHPEESQVFQDWLVSAARLGIEEITRKIKIPSTACQLIDIGGGHGLYSIALCQRYPELSAIVFDGQQALQSAIENIEMAKMGSRIVTHEGNFMTDDLGSGYDIAFLFNIIHGLSPDQNVNLLQRVAKALKPGGSVVIGDQLAEAKGGSAVQAIIQIFGLTFFQLLDARVYPFCDVADWLRSSGFTKLRRTSLAENPGISLVFGTKD